MKDNIADALGITPITEITSSPTNKNLTIIDDEQQQQPSSSTLSNNDDAIEDYRLSRKTFRNLIKQGNDAIDELSEISKQSEHPRSYEVLATLMRTVADTTKDLFDLQKKTKELIE